MEKEFGKKERINNKRKIDKDNEGRYKTQKKHSERKE
jgi:hypothetical protein